MPECRTLGSPAKAITFTYQDSVSAGVEIEYENGNVVVSERFFRAILDNFSGMRVVGGFSADNPTANGFGEWVRDNSHLNTQNLTPKHSSRIAAILVCEGFAVSERDGNAVFLNFNA